nr:defensin [Bombus eximius]
MVKVYFLVALLFVAVAAIMAVPVDEEYEPLEHVDIEERADRQRRVTCDLLSIKGVAEHSACAANCLSMGKAGGRCENGVCLCRKYFKCSLNENTANTVRLSDVRIFLEQIMGSSCGFSRFRTNFKDLWDKRFG